MTRAWRRTRFHPLLPLVLTLLLLLLAACAAGAGASADAPDAAEPTTLTSASPSDGPSVAPSEAAFPVELTDDAGRTVLLDAPAERIVSLAPSNTEIVCALGACDRIVGVTDFDDYPPEVGDVTDVVIQTQVDVELVVDAEPDLVLAAGNELTPTTTIEQLEELGLTVLVLYPETLDGVYANIELIGATVDAAEEADALVASMEERVDAVASAIEGAETPRTLYEVFYAEGTTYVAGEGSFLASLIEIAGGDPVVGDPQGAIDSESLVAADPELILLGGASYDPTLADPEAGLAAVAARPGWGELTAVVEGAVVPYLDDIVTTRPGPRVVEGLEALARAIHPDRFD